MRDQTALSRYFCILSGLFLLLLSIAFLAGYLFIPADAREIIQENMVTPFFIFSFIAFGICVFAGTCWLLYYIFKQFQQSISDFNQTNQSYIEQDKLASLGLLVASVAHEMKNPLNYIYNFSKLSSQLASEITETINKYIKTFKPEDRDAVEENLAALDSHLKIITKQSERASVTIKHILLQSRTKTEEPVEINIHELLDEYLKLSYLGVRTQNPTFNATIEKTFNAPLSSIKIQGEDVGRVFLNLFNNAYYALLKKKEALGESFTPILSVRTEIMADQFEIRIKDNGDGIPASVAKQLFTPFFTTKPVGEGTGLGLSLCRNIIEKEHHGKMSFNSKEGEFTEFIILLPLRIDDNTTTA